MTIALSPPTSTSPKHSSPLAGKPVPIPQTPPRRQSTSSTPSPRSFLAGSYPLSLLHSRIGASPPSDYTLRIRAIPTASSSSSPASPAKPLTIPFKATHYDHDGPSPWVADVDLEPYAVPPVAQLQLIVSSQQPVHAFIISYDLSEVPEDGRMLTRERSYEDNKLRYAVQLQFGREGEGYYLARTVRLVFSATRAEELRVEREDEVIPPSEEKSRRTSMDGGVKHRRRSSVGLGIGASERRKARKEIKEKGFVPISERPRSPVPPARGESLLSAMARKGKGEDGESMRGESVGAGEGVEESRGKAAGVGVNGVERGEGSRAECKDERRGKEGRQRPGLGRTDTDTELSARLGGLNLNVL